MERINSNDFRANLKEWMEAARNNPIKVTRKSGEAFVLVNAEIFEKMQIDLARLDGLTTSLIQVAQGQVVPSTDELTFSIFERAKTRAVASKKSKKVMG
jgi:prevent-host-death family protein